MDYKKYIAEKLNVDGVTQEELYELETKLLALAVQGE